MENITRFIYNNLHKITDIAVSLDTHQPMQIFHSCWWTDPDGNMPEPLTIISAKDVLDGKWIPVFEPEKSKDYVINLEKTGKKQLCIWPYHCIEGTYGCSLEGQFSNLIYFHSIVRQTDVKRIVKGLTPETEMYGIFRPEYSPDGYYNRSLLKEFARYDQIIIAGEAKSHCVLESVVQMLEYFEEENVDPGKIYVLEDCTSSITGFEEETEKAYRAIVEKYGIHIVPSTELEL